MNAANGDAALAALAAEIRDHRTSGCGFEPCETCTQLVPGEGPAAAEVMIVGEAPGAQEDRSGRPFVGGAGRLLDRLLDEVGIPRGTVFVTNVVKARPPANRDPRPAEIAHHRPWLQAQIGIVDPAVLVLLGRHALQAFVPDARITLLHGQPSERGGRVLYPTYHPAAALRAEPGKESLRADLARLPEVLAAARQARAAAMRS
jgi:DNA polymerase